MLTADQLYFIKAKLFKGVDNMTLQEIAMEMLKEVDRYTTVKEVEIPKLVQARTHKKKRINKKWKKRYRFHLHLGISYKLDADIGGFSS